MARKFENNEDQKKNSPLRISPFFCPKLGEDQKKKRSSLNISPVLAQNYVKTKDKKKRSLPRFCSFVCSNFLPKLQRRWSFRNFAYYSTLIILSWRPKGGGPWHHSPPLNTPLDLALLDLTSASPAALTVYACICDFNFAFTK